MYNFRTGGEYIVSGNLVILQFPPFAGGTYARFISMYASPVGVILLESSNFNQRRGLRPPLRSL